MCFRRWGSLAALAQGWDVRDRSSGFPAPPHPSRYAGITTPCICFGHSSSLGRRLALSQLLSSTETSATFSLPMLQSILQGTAPEPAEDLLPRPAAPCHESRCSSCQVSGQPVPTSSPELKAHSQPSDGFLAGGSIPGGTNTDTGPHLQAAAGPCHPLPGRHSPNTAVTAPGAPQAPVPAPVPSQPQSATAGLPFGPTMFVQRGHLQGNFIQNPFFFFFLNPPLSRLFLDKKKKQE